MYFRAEGTRVAGESSNWTPLAITQYLLQPPQGRKQSSGELQCQVVTLSCLVTGREPKPPAISALDPESPEFSVRPTDVPQEPAYYPGSEGTSGKHNVWTMVSCGHQGAEFAKPADLGGGLFHILCTFSSEPFPGGPASPLHQPGLRELNHSKSWPSGPSAFCGTGTLALLLRVSP